MDVNIRRNLLKYNHYIDTSEGLIHDILRTVAIQEFEGTGMDIVYYYFDGEKESNFMGRDNTMYVIINAHKDEGDVYEDDEYGTMLPYSDSTEGENIVVEGKVLAKLYYKKGEYNTLNILFDPIRNDKLSSLTGIFFEVSKSIKTRDQWSEQNKKRISEDIERFLKGSVNSRQDNINREISQVQNYIDDYSRRLVEYSVRIRSLRSQFEQSKTFDKSEIDKVIREFDLINEHDKIKSISYENGNLQFNTVSLNFFDENNQEYQGGEYRVKIDLNSGRAKIYSSYTVNGGWSDSDPHPHVSGDSNNPCFGNVTSTIAQLVGQREYFALMTVIINYLQSCDTTDSVGQYAYRWGKIIDGEVVFEGASEHIDDCEMCGEGIYDMNDLFIAYDSIYEDDDGERILDDEVRICRSCIDEYYYYDHEFDEYVRG